MILLLASAFDEAAARFAVELGSELPVRLVTCSTLALEPLCLHHPHFERSTLTVNGQVIPLRAVRGVLSLLSAIRPEEIFFYDEEERQYQASEFRACLTFLLAALTCPVVGSVSASGPSGLESSPLHWRLQAAPLGIPTLPLQLSSDDSGASFRETATATGTFEVEWLGGRLASPSGTVADEYTRRLAERTRASYLNARFCEAPERAPRFVSARTTPNLSSATTRAAVRDYFVRQS
jgi:hypothetical protein